MGNMKIELDKQTEQLMWIQSIAESKLSDANFKRKKAIAGFDGFIYADKIETLIKAQATNVVWGEIDRIISDHLTDADVLAALTRRAGQYALNTHRINSTSNVQVEIETMIRLEWVEAYKIITGQ